MPGIAFYALTLISVKLPPKVVLRLGGSILASPINAQLIKRYAEIIKAHLSRGVTMGVVVGGGSMAREYIRAATELGLANSKKDALAIRLSRVNAQLFNDALGGRLGVSLSIRSALRSISQQGFAVMGGLRPGMTTDYVAFLLAKSMEADILVKATDQEGIYDVDPRKNPNAHLIRKMSYAELQSVVGSGLHEPGIHSILDPLTVRGLPETRLKVIVFNGAVPDNLDRAINGEPIGTLVAP
ncbi:MAG TPA: UMP kinase [Thermoprotei archaeon]|nr:UMP kinase [Thermoprotei archaeon]